MNEIGINIYQSILNHPMFKPDAIHIICKLFLLFYLVNFRFDILKYGLDISKNYFINTVEGLYSEIEHFQTIFLLLFCCKLSFSFLLNRPLYIGWQVGTYTKNRILEQTRKHAPVLKTIQTRFSSICDPQDRRKRTHCEDTNSRSAELEQEKTFTRDAMNEPRHRVLSR